MIVSLEGKTALITGGSRGIGKSLVRTFLAAKARVLTTVSSPESLKQLDDLASGKLDIFVVNFNEDKEVHEFTTKLKSHEVDILVNNAGVNKIDLTENINVADFDAILKVNLRFPMLLSQLLIPSMVAKKWGRIVNITSIFGHVSKSMRASYSASKFGLLGLTKAMALDYAKENILVNGLAPGFIDTELTRKILSLDQINELVAQVPLGRLGTPEEIAKIALFLCSDQNTFITGQNIIADGGFTSV